MTKLVYTQDNGLLAIVSGTLPAHSPRGSDAITVEDRDVPADYNLHSAWYISNGKIEIDLAKAKLAAHEIRRAERDKQFAPLDFLISAQIPGNNPAEIEAQRAVIREADAVKQAAIDAAVTVHKVQVTLYGLEDSEEADESTSEEPVESTSEEPVERLPQGSSFEDFKAFVQSQQNQE